MILTKKIKNKITEWKKVGEQLAELKQQESDLRDEIALALNEEQLEGTHTVELTKRRAIRVQQTYRRVLDQDLLKEATTQLPKKVVDKLISNKPTLVKKEYDALTKKHRRIFDVCVTETPSKPVLQIVDRKDS